LKEDKEIFVLDTSALLTYIEDEAGADNVENLLLEAEKGNAVIYISFISLTEIFYITSREKDESTAFERINLIKSLRVLIQESDESLNLGAARIKAKNRISLADTYIAALCQYHKGVLVHKDPEFEKISNLIKEHRLPYKT
jgi:predicted nucleic acid-binding protein